MALNIVIIGGGASGLMAAVQAARTGASVTVLEQNEKPGRKLLATGNGRCNLTNLHQSADCYRSNSPDMVEKVLEQFTAQDTLSFFYGIGIETREREGWIYPASDQAESVLQVLLMEARQRRVKLKTRERVRAVTREGEKYLVKTETWQYPADRVIVCCGSSASSIPGSGEDALILAEKLGLDYQPFLPALCPLRCSGKKLSAWAGVRVRGAVTLLIDGRPVQREAGEIQLTDYGISGIPVFQLSRYAVRAVKEGRLTEVELDFLPDREEAALCSALEERARSCPYKSPQELLIGMFPDKLIPFFLKKGDTPEQVASAIKKLRLTVTGQEDVRKGQVCSGGILLHHLSEQLEVPGYPGIFFAGEALDVDGACGGYNLQWAWSSGAVAGRAAAKENIV